MATPTNISKPYKFLNGGPLDWWQGPWSSVAQGCSQIPNQVDTFGVNFREGKTFYARIEGVLKEYFWPTTDYTDAGVKAKLEDVYTKEEIDSIIITELSDYSLKENGVGYDTIVNPESTNKLNPSERIMNVSQMSSTGVLTISGSDTGFFAIDIPVDGNSQLRTAKNGVGVAYWRSAQFNSSDVFIAGTFIDNGASNPDGNLGLINFNPSASFVRILCREIEIASPYAVNQINYGDTVLDFEQYYPSTSRKIGNRDANDVAATFSPDVFDEALMSMFEEKASVYNGVGFSSKIQSSTNQYDFETASLTNGFINSSTGTIGSSAPGTYHPSTFISWGDNTAMVVALNGVLAYTGAYSVLQYDNDLSPISASWSGTNANIKNINKYPGAFFLRVSMREGQQNQLNFGSTVLPYEDYYTPIVTKVGDKDSEGFPMVFSPDISDEALKNNFAGEKTLLQINNIWGEFNVITVKKDGTGDFTTIAPALDLANSLSSEINQYLVALYDDFELLVQGDYTKVTDIYYAAGLVGSNTVLMGMNGKRKIYCELPAGLTSTLYETYEGLHADFMARIVNIDVTVYQIRYAIHFERSNGIINFNSLFRVYNSSFKHLGSDYWSAPDAMGCGLTTGVNFHLESGSSTGARYGFRAHSNTLDDMPNHLKFTNWVFASMLSAGFAVYIDNTPTSRNDRTVEMNGCQVEGIFYFSIAMSTGASKIDKIVPTMRILGSGNKPFYAQNSQSTGRVLRVKSITTGVASIVKVISDPAGLFGTKTTDDGTLGLPGYVYGNQELVESGNANRSNKIGHRLGDCSVMPKTMTLNIDGTNRDVVFNQNYSDGNFTVNPLINDTTILASINSQLSGFAVADYFQVNLEYYPELSDVLFYKGNTSATAFIPKGSFVKFIGLNQCRICVADEYADGMAIDDIPVSSTIMKMGRIIKNCIVANAGRFLPLFNGSYTAGQSFKTDSLGRLQADATAKDSFAVALSTTRILIK